CKQNINNVSLADKYVFALFTDVARIGCRESTRSHILSLLRGDARAVSELAAAPVLAESAVRTQLDRLARDGFSLPEAINRLLDVLQQIARAMGTAEGRNAGGHSCLPESIISARITVMPARTQRIAQDARKNATWDIAVSPMSQASAR